MDARSIADALIVAERERKAITPFTDAAPALDAETAYRAQRMMVQHRLDAGERIIGAKLGLTSRAKQEAMGVREPLYGWLTSGMVLPYGEPLPLAEFIHPRVEPEIAFLIGRELEPPVTGIDLRLVGVLVTRNGAVIDTGAGAAALGNPARCVAWLANKLGAFGDCLHPGDIVLPGAVHRMVPVRPGDAFRAEFAHLGAVTARFSNGASNGGGSA